MTIVATTTTTIIIITIAINAFMATTIILIIFTATIAIAKRVIFAVAIIESRFEAITFVFTCITSIITVTIIILV